MGFFLSLLCLLPLGYVLFEECARALPNISDIATDAASPPGLVTRPAILPIAPPSSLPSPMPVIVPIPSRRRRCTRSSSPWPNSAAAIRARRKPQTPLAEGQLNAIAMTLIGYRSEVAVRVQGDPQAATVSMRSAWLFGGHDRRGQGRGRGIEREFLTALDDRVTQILRNAPPLPVR